MDHIYWNGIRSFILVAETGSITAASKKSGLSKANISQQISELEKSLRLQLFFRTTRQIRLTDIGEDYYKQCKQGMIHLEQAFEWANQNARALKGKIRMNSVGGYIGEEMIAPLVIAFQKENPEIHVDLSFSSQKEDLLSQPYDLTLRMGDLSDSSLVAKRLKTLTTRYATSPEFMAEHGEINHPKDLNGLPLVCGSIKTWTFRRKSEEYNVHFQKGFQVGNGEVMKKAAIAGLGVARLIDVYVLDELKEGSLVEVLPDWRIETPVSLVCPPNRYQLHRVKALMDFIAENF